MSEKAKKTYSSKFVFFWIGASLAAMTGFMFICKDMGVLNPRENWEMEFTELSKMILDFHQEDHSDLETLMSSDDVKIAFKKYAGHQVELRSQSKLNPVFTNKMFLNRKQLSMISFSDLIEADPKSTVVIKRNFLSVALYPIAKRQLTKTYKFAKGSFLWHAYTFEVNPNGNSGNELKFLEIKNVTTAAGKNKLNLVAANYMNDYFIIAVADKSHTEIVESLVQTLSLYHSDFIRTL